MAETKSREGNCAKGLARYLHSTSELPKSTTRRRVLVSVGSILTITVGGAIAGQTTASTHNEPFAQAIQTENEPPIANISYTPSNPSPGDSVTFDASQSSDPDGNIVAYSWATLTEEGNAKEQIGIQEEIEYTFESSGVYRIGLEVRDDEGAIDRAGVRITVGSDGTIQQRGFFTNSGTDPEWLSNPTNLTLLGVILSIIGILQQMIGGR